ncbi:MAG TPA: hypothetical protein VFN66_03810 [Burkholderiales bacterium]|nr:hypothetical protein [Burkholderiales bacterium]
MRESRQCRPDRPARPPLRRFSTGSSDLARFTRRRGRDSKRVAFDYDDRDLANDLYFAQINFDAAGKNITMAMPENIKTNPINALESVEMGYTTYRRTATSKNQPIETSTTG